MLTILSAPVATWIYYHFNNFIKTIRGEAKLNSPVDEGHKSVLLCHLANIAQRTGTHFALRSEKWTYSE